MQNTPQTFRGTVAPGVNYSEHTYDNHINSHCQSGGYQPYSNQVYHPRPHHYANHQMQQNMPYRHHGGGAYAPNQNQYRPSMNQDLYRNHHPGYASSNNRNVPSKTWTENANSSDLMPPYGQTSPHSQMMNNSQMPVTAMRSPPHAPSNINQPSQGQQHFRPMQSPAHSPHSWSQAQIPSPNMIHPSRTSPLPTHVRSPGHSQPFSPPAAHSISLQPHPPSQENGQIPPNMNNPASTNENHNPGNPLHSLQKMVLLDQESKSMNLPVDGSDQFPNQCGPHNFRAEGTSSCDGKDSQYSTYYNIDEDRFESKPNNSANDASPYTPMQQMTNCNFPIPSHPVSNEADLSNIARIPGNNPNIVEPFQSNSNQNSLSSQMSNSILEQSQCKSNVSLPDCASIQNECPPHAESAPLFTDQTKAAVSTNSEQALESKSHMNWTSDISDPEKASIAQIPAADAAGTPQTSVSQEQSTLSQPLSSNHSSEKSSKEHVNSEKSSCNDHALKNAADLVPESTTEKHNHEMQHPSISSSSSESQDYDSNTNSSDSKSSSSYEDSHSSGKQTSKHESDISFEVPSPDSEKANSIPDSNSRSENTNDSKKVASTSVSNQKETESSYSPPPVKVVIHRIRKNDADDTWHVPGNTKKPIQGGKESENDKEKMSEPKSTSSGPQIIMLSQALSGKNDNKNTEESGSLAGSEGGSLAIKTEDSDLPETLKEEPASPLDKSLNADKKRGRPVGSKNKMKPPTVGKKKKGKKGLKNKKGDTSKQKIVDTASKLKKNKNFNGPYVHITGSKENPSAISVINVAQKEEEKLSKTQTKRITSSAINRIKSKTVGHLSTLSPTYDAYNRDKTWVCIFCQKGSHHGGLGDLYGPYYIKNNSEEKSSPSNSGSSLSRSKRKKSEADDTKPAKKAKQSSAQSTPNRSQNSQNADDQDSSENMKEVWIHEDCAVWCQSITLLGEEVRGLEEAVAEANENKCSQCSFQGATLGCWGKGCKEMYHYTCAKQIGCQLDIEKFSLLCSKHQKRNENQKRCQ